MKISESYMRAFGKRKNVLEQDSSSISNVLNKTGKSQNQDVNKFDPIELKYGIKIEQEHIEDDVVAQEIAEDHLIEDPKYYTHLIIMEKISKMKLEGVQKILVSKFQKKEINNDNDLHLLAEQLKINPHDLEGEVYKLLSLTVGLFNI
jgi:hypothetical protein